MKLKRSQKNIYTSSEVETVRRCPHRDVLDISVTGIQASEWRKERVKHSCLSHLHLIIIDKITVQERHIYTYIQMRWEEGKK